MLRSTHVLLITALVVSAVMLAAPCARAQYGYGGGGSYGQQKLWNIKAGLVFPSGNTVDSSELMIGIEYAYPLGKINSGTVWTLRTSRGSRLLFPPAPMRPP